MNPALVTVNNTTKNYTFSGAKIGGPAPLIKQGAGSLTLSNTGNDYTGGTSIQGGTIILGVANALPTAGNVTVAGGTLNLGGLSQDLSGALVLDSGTIANGTVNKSGADYDLRAGTVSATLARRRRPHEDDRRHRHPLGRGELHRRDGDPERHACNSAWPTPSRPAPPSRSAPAPTAACWTSTASASRSAASPPAAPGPPTPSPTPPPPPRPSPSTSPTGTPTFAGVISGNLTFEKQGAGTLNLTGANTYTGGTNLNGGVLSFAAGALGTSGSIAFTGNSTLRWATGNTEDISPRLAALPSGVTATFDTNGQTVTLSGTISGAGALAKAGGGTLILTAANTYAGGTTHHRRQPPRGQQRRPRHRAGHGQRRVRSNWATA